MGTNIQSSKGLPVLDENGKVPKLEAHLVERILAADGFAEVCVLSFLAPRMCCGANCGLHMCCGANTLAVMRVVATVG